MNYQVGNYISTEYGELQIKHVVFDSYQVTGKDGRTLWANKVEPIKLTEKLVIFLGLDKMPISEHTLDTYDLCSIKLWNKRGVFLFNDKIEIKYVNQLQDLISALKINV